MTLNRSKEPPDKVNSHKVLVSLAQLAGLCDTTSTTILNRVRAGQLTPADEVGMFDRDLCVAEFHAKPKQNGGMKPGPKRLKVSEGPQRHDPDYRLRVARAELEEFKLQKLKSEHFEVQLGRRRIFSLIRMIRDRVQGWVPRTAPTLAAKFKADEGEMYRVLDVEIRKLLTELQSLPIDQIFDLATDFEGDSPDDSVPEPPEARP